MGWTKPEPAPTLRPFRMAAPNLAPLAVALGLGLGAFQIWALLRPAAWRAFMLRLPRHRAIGSALVLAATAWFLLYLRSETLADFARFRPALMAGFGAIGVLSCLYVTDLLGARGLALILLLLAKLMVDTARWHPSEWRWVVTGLAYLWVIAGIWWTISPWRLRDAIEWNCRTESRIRNLAWLRLALGALLVGLGLTVYRRVGGE